MPSRPMYDTHGQKARRERDQWLPGFGEVRCACEGLAGEAWGVGGHSRALKFTEPPTIEGQLHCLRWRRQQACSEQLQARAREHCRTGLGAGVSRHSPPGSSRSAQTGRACPLAACSGPPALGLPDPALVDGKQVACICGRPGAGLPPARRGPGPWKAPFT